MIRVLQASAWYPPHYLGGTEVYLTGLVQGLRRRGVVSRIVTPLAPQAQDYYQYDGATVRTYSVNSETSRRELRGRKPHDGFDRFCEILREEKPDIYHQHSWTRGLGASHLSAARAAGLKTVLTLHTPNVVCLRGTMMRLGHAPCDGEIGISKCAECWSHARGASKMLSRVLASVPSAFGVMFEASGLNARIATALSARGIASEKRQEFARLVDCADRIVAVCGWLYDALLRNGVPAAKLLLSRQGVDDSFAASGHARDVPRNGPFRLIYVGRWHLVKGVEVVVKAVLAIAREVPLELVIHGLGTGPEERSYEASIRNLAAQDHRIHIAPPVPRERLAETLREADLLAVPSLWLETGPLVVLEAKAVGLPIIGSRLGGIAELVREPEDGALLPPNDIEAWTQAIINFSRTHQASVRKRHPQDVRAMQDAAEDMAALYRSLC